MITTKTGDIFEHATGVIVHGCNAQGRMGSGIALQVKNLHPKAYKDYRDAFETTGLMIGDVIYTDIGNNRTIISAITQEFYGTDRSKQYVSYEAIETCFNKINEMYKGQALSINFPLIGCDRGGGSWTVVSQIIDRSLKDFRDDQKILWRLN